jgi:hypothetical protein
MKVLPDHRYCGESCGGDLKYVQKCVNHVFDKWENHWDKNNEIRGAFFERQRTCNDSE